MQDLIERVDVAPAPPPAGERARRPYLWWLAGAGTIALLVLLGVAEATWLHDLPQDRASRISLLAVPAAGPADGAGTLPADWSAGLLADAASPALLTAVIAQLDLRDAKTGQPLTAPALAANLHLGEQCIDVRAGSAPPRRGLMINAVVRTTGALDPDAVARAWSDRFIAHGRAAWPGLTIQPAMGARYELCG
jgi:hypothetical protein